MPQNLEQQAIVWVDVPYSNLGESKIRPAVVISNNDYNSKSSDVIICAITSNLQKTPYSILISQKDLSYGSLPIQSKIKADKIMQIEKNKISGTFAYLNNETFDLVIKEIINLISKRK